MMINSKMAKTRGSIYQELDTMSWRDQVGLVQSTHALHPDTSQTKLAASKQQKTCWPRRE